MKISSVNWKGLSSPPHFVNDCLIDGISFSCITTINRVRPISWNSGHALSIIPVDQWDTSYKHTEKFSKHFSPYSKRVKSFCMYFQACSHLPWRCKHLFCIITATKQRSVFCRLQLFWYCLQRICTAEKQGCM